MAMQYAKTVATDETNTLISSDKVEGTTVYDRKGEKLGSIHSVMIDKVSGKVAYAVMSFGGFLGIGDRYHPLPWHLLTYHTGQGGYVVDLDPSRLKGAPTYGTRETPNWSDRRWGQQVHDYYGLASVLGVRRRAEGAGCARPASSLPIRSTCSGASRDPPSARTRDVALFLLAEN